MDFLAFDAVVVGYADDRFLTRLTSPSVVARPVRRVKSHWLEPRMPFGTHAVLLGDLALEEMNLRAVGRQ